MTEITLKNELASFDAMKAQAQALADLCNQITITDEVTLGIAKQNLSKANDKVKQIEAIRITAKAPYLAAGKEIDSMAKALSSPIEDAVNAGKKKILAYEAIKEQERQKEIARINNIKSSIQRYADDAIMHMSAAKTEAELIEVHFKWIKQFPGQERWFEFMEDAAQMRQTLLDFAKARKIEINTPDQADAATTEIIEQYVKDTIESVGSNKIAEIEDVAPTKGIRTNWTFEVIDISQVPLKYLMVDEKKIKEYIKENKDKLTDGLVVKGIKFLTEKTVTLR